MGDVIYFRSYLVKGGENMQTILERPILLSEKDIINFTKITLYFLNKSNVRIYKTKLNKLLFYSQFFYYKTFEKRFLAGNFIKDHYGPVLEELELYLNSVENKGYIEILTSEYGTYITPKVKVKQEAYTEEEELILSAVYNKLEFGK